MFFNLFGFLLDISDFLNNFLNNFIYSASENAGTPNITGGNPKPQQPFILNSILILGEDLPNIKQYLFVLGYASACIIGSWKVAASVKGPTTTKLIVLTGCILLIGVYTKIISSLLFEDKNNSALIDKKVSLLANFNGPKIYHYTKDDYIEIKKNCYTTFFRV